MRPRLLLIEDDAALRRSLVLTLADEGFQVQEAPDGQQGLRGLDGTPDAVLLDLGLPDIDGYDLCARLRQRTKGPIVIISAHRAPSNVARGLQAGADDYLVKPFGAVELARRLRGLLDGSPTAPPGAPTELGLRSDRGGAARVEAGDGGDVGTAQSLDLTVVEARLFGELAARSRAEVARDVLARQVWGEPPAAGAGALTARISSLCRKLEAAGRASVETTDTGYRLSS